ncbi:MAG: hypothetical protein ACO390_07990, partial [bacterium]
CWLAKNGCRSPSYSQAGGLVRMSVGLVTYRFTGDSIPITIQFIQAPLASLDVKRSPKSLLNPCGRTLS